MEQNIKPTWPGTVVICAACVVGWFVNHEADTAYAAARGVSFLLLVAIVISILSDWRSGLRNLVRSDIFALLALYFLLYFEFLFPQPNFEVFAIFEHVQTSIDMTLAGFVALSLGRHVSFGHWNPFVFTGKVNLKPTDYVVVLLGAFFISNLSQWVSVGFNMAEWFSEMLEPRFSRPWSRGRYGDASALLSELSLLGYLVPPLAGLIFAKRKEVNVLSLVLVTICLGLMLFKGFTDGTRNVLAVYLAGFAGGYFLVNRKIKVLHVGVGGICMMVLFVIMSNYMLEFRNMGLRRYVEEGRYKPSYREFYGGVTGSYSEETESTYFVDYNLHTMSLLVAVFPSNFDYLGWNLPYVAITKPIPRVLWSSKPTGLEVGMEEAIGAKGMTVAASFIGEAYISYGLAGIVLTGLVLGAFCGWWNKLALQLHSPLSLAIYTSGFFAILITMRSLMFFTTAILPSLALLLFARILYSHQQSQ